jgi:chromosome segregation ATPase
MSLSRVVPVVLVLLASCVASSSAQVAGDNGQAPTTAAECRAKVKAVDAALEWENARWAKLRDRKLALRSKLTKKAAAIRAKKADLQAQIDALQPQFDAAKAAAAADPSLENEALDLENAILLLEQDVAENKQKLPGIAYQLEDLDAELGRLKKLHRSNVRNTVKYRKQVADYCKRF